MYRMELVNALTQEVLRENNYEKPYQITEQIKSFEKNKVYEGTKGMECFIFDNRGRTLKARYVTHSIFNEGGTTVYKLFFNVKLNDIQVPIA